MRIPENPVRIDTDPNHRLRKFIDLARPTGRKIMRAFKDVRCDADRVNPSYLIYPNSEINEISSTLSEEEQASFTRMAYVPNVNVIMASQTAIFANLAKGPDGLDDLARFTATQAIFAQATQVVDNNLRVGFAMLPFPRLETGLVPGAFYDITQHEEREDDHHVGVFNEEAPKLAYDMLLTRRMTYLLQLCMVEKINNSSTRPYPHLFIYQEGKPVLQFANKKPFIDLAMKSLSTGRLEDFDRAMGTDLILERFSDKEPIIFKASRGVDFVRSVGISLAA